MGTDLAKALAELDLQRSAIEIREKRLCEDNERFRDQVARLEFLLGVLGRQYSDIEMEARRHKEALDAVNQAARDGRGDAHAWVAGEDNHLESLVCPVVIPAQWLRDLLDQRAEQERQKVGGLRPEVLAFAMEMELRLRANDHKAHWPTLYRWRLFARLEEEMSELKRALEQADRYYHDEHATAVREEAADVGNFAMMVAHVAGALMSSEGGLRSL